jgi:uncharacterized membrane protein SpoIIM required for sporulation
MKTAELLESRRANWTALEHLCDELESRRQRRLPAELVARFAALYRAACADLALSDAYQLPAATVHYLHQLVGRAHNQLYRSRRFQLSEWRETLFRELPRRLFADGTLWLATLLFWGIFFASLALAAVSPAFVHEMLGDQASQYEDMYKGGLGRRSSHEDTTMAAFYIQHNTSIGLQCFAYGLLFGVGGLFVTAVNAASIGAVFGYMLTTSARGNFLTFVTAHGPCELTAIVLCSAAGMRLGFALIRTDGLSRSASLRAAGQQAMPTVGVACVLFFAAALIEGFVSPAPVPYWTKAVVAIISAALIFSYIVVLGYPRGGADAVR